MTGISNQQFTTILVLFQDYVDKYWTEQGYPSDFSLEDKPLLTFRYLRGYLYPSINHNIYDI